MTEIAYGSKKSCSSELYIWYKPNSYFEPHWSPWLTDRGFDSLGLNPGDKVTNSQAILKRTVNGRTISRILMTAGELPFDLPTFRSLGDAQSTVFTSDDEWRFTQTSRYLPFYFDWVATNFPPRVDDYLRHKVTSVIPSSYAANTTVFHKTTDHKRFDAMMVGAAHPERVTNARAVLASGIRLNVFGPGWSRYSDLKHIWGGVLSTTEMVDTISAARVVVNSGYTLSGVPQIKGRLFETAACGSFQLTGDIPRLSEYYKIGKELDVFRDTHELLQKLRYYIDHDSEREIIARAGYERTKRDHSWNHRLEEIHSATSVAPSGPPILPKTRGLIFSRVGSDLEGVDLPVGIQIVEWDGSDIRPIVEQMVSKHPGLFVGFSEPLMAYDRDYLKLLSYGLANSQEHGVVANLAPFDVTDKQGRVFACAQIATLASRSPEQTPLSSYFVLGSSILAAATGAALNSDRLQFEIMPTIIENGPTESINLGTGLFSVPGTGAWSISNVFRSSISGSWDMRTRPYARQALRGLSAQAMVRLGLGLYARRSARRSFTSKST